MGKREFFIEELNKSKKEWMTNLLFDREYISNYEISILLKFLIYNKAYSLYIENTLDTVFKNKISKLNLFRHCRLVDIIYHSFVWEDYSREMIFWSTIDKDYVNGLNKYKSKNMPHRPNKRQIFLDYFNIH